MSPRRALAALGVLAVLVAGCDPAAGGDDGAPEPVRPGWRELTLPAPPGPPGRVQVRDAAACGGRWFVVGGVADAAGETRPAAWSSVDGATWTALALHPRTYYGERHVFYSAACRDGRVALLGAKRGGAHANPRTSSWRQLPDGSLDEVIAPFDLFGGPYAVDVARMVAGGRGWLITGNRTSGAAVWWSSDSARFTLVEREPQLASDGAGETWNFDAVETAAGWLSVGGIVPAGRVDRDPLAWISPDGVAWRRVPVPGGPEYDELQRVVALDGRPVAVGLRGRAFGAWRADGDPGGAWRAAGGFGRPRADGIPGVRGLAVTGATLWAATTDGFAYAVWRSVDGGDAWVPVTLPGPAPAGAERAVALLGAGDDLLLLIDDGQRSRVFLARLTD
ncbi:hypothetical protein K7640_12635 [Micromonospora sp. PLK6-60]|uniref:hypothetical protein n=1 Tax=Micromonospora sp. PLK6-60 TaxID=2873383 RepID=UPI001CA718FD|nr:hypothetical protein [Micromonospora sp. PLK6-60]MBY8872683.1 hypothetical protein [Micromonospora sp. PLK6-60]